MKKTVKKLLNYIEISNFERGGLFVLLFLLVIVTGYYYLRNSSTPASYNIDHTALASFRSQVDSAFASRQYPNKKYENKKYKKSNPTYALQMFDPNNDTEDQLIAKGVPSYAARGIVRFRGAGGSFKHKQEVKKIYAIDEEMYSLLEPFISIAEIFPKEVELIDTTSKKKERKEFVPININTATIEQLVDLPGIGDFYAKQIIEYRDKLGGYRNKSQLLEVYRMRAETVEQIGDMFVYDKEVRQIQVNSATFKELLAHPYLGYNQVKSIVNYREQHGPFKDIDAIAKLHIFKGKDVSGILPYLDLN